MQNLKQRVRETVVVLNCTPYDEFSRVKVKLCQARFTTTRTNAGRSVLQQQGLQAAPDLTMESTRARDYLISDLVSSALAFYQPAGCVTSAYFAVGHQAYCRYRLPAELAATAIGAGSVSSFLNYRLL